MTPQGFGSSWTRNGQRVQPDESAPGRPLPSSCARAVSAKARGHRKSTLPVPPFPPQMHARAHRGAMSAMVVRGPRTSHVVIMTVSGYLS
jgi:hypothetical protein